MSPAPELPRISPDHPLRWTELRPVNAHPSTFYCDNFPVNADATALLDAFHAAWLAERARAVTAEARPIFWQERAKKLHEENQELEGRLALGIQLKVEAMRRADKAEHELRCANAAADFSRPRCDCHDCTQARR